MLARVPVRPTGPSARRRAPVASNNQAQRRFHSSPVAQTAASASTQGGTVFFHAAPGDIKAVLVPFHKKVAEARKLQEGTLTKSAPAFTKAGKPRRRLTDVEIEEINRLRHESLFYWTRKKLSKRFKVPLAVIDKVSTPIKYKKQVRLAFPSPPAMWPAFHLLATLD